MIKIINTITNTIILSCIKLTTFPRAGITITTLPCISSYETSSMSSSLLLSPFVMYLFCPFSSIMFIILCVFVNSLSILNAIISSVLISSSPTFFTIITSPIYIFGFIHYEVIMYALYPNRLKLLSSPTEEIPIKIMLYNTTINIINRIIFITFTLFFLFKIDSVSNFISKFLNYI